MMSEGDWEQGIEALREEFERKLKVRDEKIAELRAELENEREQQSQFRDENEQLHNHVAHLNDRIDDLEEENEHLESANEQLEERVDELESQPELEITEESDPIGSLEVDGYPVGRVINSKPAETDLEDRLDELKTDLHASDHTPEGGDSGTSPTIETETYLEEVVTYPEAVVERELTENQIRARFLAKDVREYAKRVPAGWSISPGNMKRVLKAAFDNGHTNTVNRVREILDDLGEDEVRIVERRGAKKVIFEQSLVSRLERLATDHTEVMPATA